MATIQNIAPRMIVNHSNVIEGLRERLARDIKKLVSLYDDKLDLNEKEVQDDLEANDLSYPFIDEYSNVYVTEIRKDCFITNVGTHELSAENIDSLYIVYKFLYDYTERYYGIYLPPTIRELIEEKEFPYEALFFVNEEYTMELATKTIDEIRNEYNKWKEVKF